MISLFFNSFFIGLGMAFGVLGAVGILQLLTKALTYALIMVFPNKFDKWKFGDTYNNYQTVIINGTEWIVQPSPMDKMLVLRQTKTDKTLILNEYDKYDDICEGVDQMEVKLQPKTDEVA